MRVGFDARLTRQQSVGMRTYVVELRDRLPRVAPEFEFAFFDRGGNFGWQEQVALPAAIRRARVDVVHFPSLYVPLAFPRNALLTIHDLIHLRFPEYFKSKVGPYYRTVVRRAAALARRVITDDPRTVADLQRFLGVDPEKVRVIPLGVSERFFGGAQPFRGPRPYLLYVGNHREHKDLPTLFDAWSALPQVLGIDLYLTGPDDFGGELERRRRGELRIHALGDVSAEALAGYYAGALALVSPALCEGFGLPMLEAMAAGCPVAACDDAVPHVLASASATFRARDADGLRVQLERLATDPAGRAAAIERGRALARDLTWDRCARATADVYAEVLATAC